MTDPTRIDVRAYNVGFGDCILVSFTYAAPVGDDRAERHLLIDFGTNRANPHGPSLKDIGGFIAAATHGKLDAVVLTHRHRDHLAGFDPSTGGTTIAGLKPDAVVRPWTEVPDGAPQPAATDTPAHQALRGVLAAGKSFAASFADAGLGRGEAENELLGLASMQLGNDAAIQQLDELAATSKGYYLRFGDPLPLDMLPGVTITVLGPPDPSVWPAVRTEAASSTQYWLGPGGSDAAALHAARAGAGPIVVGDGDVQALLEPGPGRWLIDRVDDHLVRSAERLVHQLDSVLNNTSLVLLVEAAGHKLLFPGDAQVENWAYALTAAPNHDAICAQLQGVELYKVGHHGSRNATPRLSLFPLLAQAGATGRVAVMSTLPGTYDKSNAVPSDALVAGLSAPPFTLLRTDVLAAGARCVHVAASGSGSFAPSSDGDQ